MVKIKILVSCGGTDFSYIPGEVVEVSTERAADLVKHNLAEYVASTAAQTAKVGTPKAETRKKP
ncbi:hypothetical protein [Spirosoma sp.]|uniref:hypothetical protein n=1 Tax=Spirosoma sp. TaxID=1899569 RepID=UPI003B3AA823